VRGLVLFLRHQRRRPSSPRKAFRRAARWKRLRCSRHRGGRQSPGDLNSDGKLRWDASLASGSVDLGNLDSLIASLRASAPSSDDPLLVLGMSNGGSMAVTLGSRASASAAAFPDLRFAAAIVLCRGGGHRRSR
jgi:hypothetical protein